MQRVEASVNRFLSVLFWSVIAAAFIGPGTITTAASAGAGFGYALLWALVFSTAACLVLQEASARITVVSGRNLGQALREQYRGGVRGLAVLLLVLGSIVLGCAAYEAGNILGGVAGAALGTGLPRGWLTLLCGALAGSLLWFGAVQTVARLLGLFVAVMGAAFLFTAWRLAPPAAELFRGALVPALPEGSGLIVIGLVGTTVVPYNLFLGSGLARGQKLRELRFGLSVAILLGGLISMAVVVVGTAVERAFDFGTLAAVLEERLGEGSRTLFAVGLFAAGLSSAITAPLAAAITTRSLLASRDDPGWGDRSLRFRFVWLSVLVVGVAFGLADVRPIPAILLAQALNGVLLPLVAIFLLLAVNDRGLMGRELNGAAANTLLGIVAAVTLVLGVNNVTKALASALKLSHPGELRLLLWSSGVALLAAGPVVRRLLARRSRTPPPVANTSR
jgi:Mn2+/Fe2+ NRAMP family transporter